MARRFTFALCPHNRERKPWAGQRLTNAFDEGASVLGAEQGPVIVGPPATHTEHMIQSPPRARGKPHHTNLLFGRRASELHAYNQPSQNGIIGLALPSYDAKRPQSMHPGRQAGFARQDVDADVVVVPFIAARRAGALVWASKRSASANFLRQQSIRGHLMPTLQPTTSCWQQKRA